MSPPDLPTIPSAIVEGVGSEVVVCVCILLAGLILVAAWLSTYVPQDMRPIAVFVFDNIARVRHSATGNSSIDASVSTDTLQQDSTAIASAEATTETNARDASVNEQEVATVESPGLQSASNAASTTAGIVESHSSIANYDVDMLESDSELDPETRERVADVLHEYTQVMEANSESELRNRHLKYFNCLIPSESSNESGRTSAAGTSTNNTAEIDEAVTPEQQTPELQPAIDNRSDQQTSELESTQPATTPATDTSCAATTAATTNAAAAAATAAAATAADVSLSSDYRPPGSLLLKLKYFNDDLRTVFASPTELITTFKRRHFQTELSRNMNIRLIYNGRELKEGTDRTLASYSIPEEATIHCLVTERTEEPVQAEESANQLDGQSDIGNYMFPLFGGILGLIWYCRVCYKAYFNFMSTMALGAVTLLFFAAFFASWSSRSPRQTGQIQVHRINLDAADSRQARPTANAASSSSSSSFTSANVSG